MNNYKMKREGSRFTIDQVNKQVRNWEEIASEKFGKFELRKRVYSDKGLLEQITNYERQDVMYNSLLFLDVHIPYGRNNIKVSTSEVKTPIFSYPLITKNQFNFSIRCEDYFDKISKVFGQKELQINDKDFDDKFFIETNESKLLNAFLDHKIRNWLEQLKIAYFDFNTAKSKNALTLYCLINEMDKKEIEEALNMFKYCIDRLKNVKL